MIKQQNFANMIYEDTFQRLDRAFDDESFGRVLKAALKYSFTKEEPRLESDIERYACEELICAFERNKASYDQKIIDGKINAAIRWAADETDLERRLNEIEGITQEDIAKAASRIKNRSIRVTIV